jgi:putative transposase
MAKPLRIASAGALSHSTSRGDRREAIFADDDDRERFLGALAAVGERSSWVCHADCLMSNHLVVATLEGNLSQGMRHWNGVYPQASSRRQGRGGHRFQGRFKGVWSIGTRICSC